MVDVSDASASGINEAMAVVQQSCRRILGDAAAADDAAQAVFLVYWRKRRQLRDHPRLLAWFQRTAVLVCRQELRSRRRRRHHEAGVADPRAAVASPAEGVGDAESLRILEEELAAIPTRYAEVLTRQYLLEQSRSQIAKAMRVPAGTVATWANRGREALKARLLRRGVSAGAVAGLGALAPATLGAATTAAGSASLASPAATALAERALRHFFVLKLKVAGAVLGVAALGIGGAVAAVPDAEPEPAPVVDREAADAGGGDPPAAEAPQPWRTPASRRLLGLTWLAAGGGEPLRYTLRPGDTLDAIGRGVFGPEYRGDRLLAVNPDLRAEDLRAGVELRIPPDGRRSLGGVLDLEWLRRAGAHTAPTSLFADPDAAAGVAALIAASRHWPRMDAEFFPVVEFVDGAAGLAIAGAGSNPVRGPDSQLQVLWHADAAAPAVAAWAEGLGLARRKEAPGAVLHQHDDDVGVVIADDGLGGLALRRPLRLLAALQTPPPDVGEPDWGLRFSVDYRHLVDLLAELAEHHDDPLELERRLPDMRDQPPRLVATMAPEDGRWRSDVVLHNAPALGLRPVDPRLLARVAGGHQVQLAVGIELDEFLASAALVTNPAQRQALEAFAAGWLAPCSGDLALALDWSGEPVDPQRPDVLLALGLDDGAAFAALVDPLLQAQGFAAERDPAGRRRWQGELAGRRWWIAVDETVALLASDEVALAGALSEPAALAEATPALRLRCDLPALATWLLPLWRAAIGDEPIVAQRGTDPLRLGLFMSDLAATLDRLGPEAGIAELLEAGRPETGGQERATFTRIAAVERTLGPEHLAAGIALYRRGDGEAGLVYRSAGAWHVTISTSLVVEIDGEERSVYRDAFADPAVVAAIFPASWRRLGPAPADLRELPVPVLFDPAWLPSDAVLIRHLPRYELELLAGDDLRLVERGAPLASVVTAGAAAAFWAEGERELRELHYRALRERDREAVAARHTERLAALRRAVEALRAKARANADRWHEDYATWPHDPGWLIRAGKLDLADASLIAGRPIADARAFQAVGEWQDDANLVVPHDLDRAPRDPLMTQTWERLWTVELEPGWFAVVSNAGLQVVLTPWPCSTEPRDEQLQPAPDAAEPPPSGADSF